MVGLNPLSSSSLRYPSPILGGYVKPKTRLLKDKSVFLSPQDAAFARASVGGQLIRIFSTVLLIILTLGLILCFMTPLDLLNWNFSVLVPDLDEPLTSDMWPPIPPSLLVSPSQPVVPSSPVLKFPSIKPKQSLNLLDILQGALLPKFSAWDNGQILTHFVRLSETHKNLYVPALTSLINTFSLKNAVLSSFHLLDPLTQKILEKPDLSCCIHKNEDAYPHLKDRNCTDFSIYAYPLWHHPSSSDESSMNQDMLQTSKAGTPGLSHWTLVIIDTQRRSVVFFDSLANFIDPGLIHPILNDVAKIAGDTHPDQNGNTPPFQVQKVISSPIQMDGSSCGIWISMFLERYLENPDCSFLNQKNTDQMLQEFLDSIPNRPLTTSSEQTKNILHIISSNSPHS